MQQMHNKLECMQIVHRLRQFNIYMRIFFCCFVFRWQANECPIKTETAIKPRWVLLNEFYKPHSCPPTL